MSSSELVIRRGASVDAALLAAFAARTFEETFGTENRPEDMRAHLASTYGARQQTKELLDPSVTTLLAFIGEELIAYAQVRRSTPPPCVIYPEAVELHRFYVDRRAHGAGVAAKLMAAVHGAAREHGGDHLWLGVWERNLRAMAFYRKCNFADVGSAVYCVGSDPQTDRVMVSELPR